MRSEDPPRRHGGEEVGDLDAVQHVCVEGDDEARRGGVGLLVEPEVLGVSGHRIQGPVRLGIELISNGGDHGVERDGGADSALACLA